VIDGEFASFRHHRYDYATMTLPADVKSQTRNASRPFETALKDGGFAMADIVRAP